MISAHFLFGYRWADIDIDRRDRGKHGPRQERKHMESEAFSESVVALLRHFYAIFSHFFQLSFIMKASKRCKQ
jgi:hypothetical protein